MHNEVRLAVWIVARPVNFATWLGNTRIAKGLGLGFGLVLGVAYIKNV